MDANSMVDSITYRKTVSYVNAGSIAILVFDSLLTFDQEIRVIWSQKWTYIKFLYVLTRYSAVVGAGIEIYGLTIPGELYAECLLVRQMNTFLIVFGLGVGEAIMTMRTWVAWEKNRFLTYALPIFYIFFWVGGFTTIGIFLQSLRFEPNARTPYIGCYTTQYDPIAIFLSWALLLLYDKVMFILMIIAALRARVYRSPGRSPLLEVVYRDGVLYYFYLYVISLVNIMIALTFPSDLVLLITLLSRVIHAVLACRVVLHIRECGHSMSDDPPDNNNHSLPKLPTGPYIT